MKRVILFMMFVVAVGMVTGEAQERGGQRGGNREGGQRGGQRGGQKNNTAFLETLTKELELTDKQAADVKKVFEARQTEMAKMFKSGEERPSREEIQKIMAESSKKIDADLLKILGEEKFAKYKELEEAQKEKRKKSGRSSTSRGRRTPPKE